jgi:geranylgeranyl diphosphate synthase type I
MIYLGLGDKPLSCSLGGTMVVRPPASPSGEPGTTPETLTGTMTRLRGVLEPALREAVAGLHPWGGDMASFSLGWTEANGTPLHGSGDRGFGDRGSGDRGSGDRGSGDHGSGSVHGGKSLRPALALLCAEAVGGSPEQAVPGALAVEFVHAFSLVHDDIIDHDERRRHRDSVWKAFGIGPAVLTGDALLALAIGRLSAAGNHRAVGHLSAALLELVHGQTEDMAFEERPWTGRNAVTVDEYCAMAARKTGSLLGCAAALGVTLGGGPAELADRMYEIVRELGVAFQIADDLLGIWGDPAVTGKPVHGDLRRGKKTLPVLAALAAGGPASGELAGLLGSGAVDDDSLRQAAELTDVAGGRALARRMADQRVSAAMAALDDCLPHAPELRALCLSLADRSR